MEPQNLSDYVANWYFWWDGLKEPERTGCLASALASNKFEAVSLTVIILNTCFLVWTTNYEATSGSEPLPSKMTFIERCFVLFYLGEFTLKLVVHGKYFMCNASAGWNAFDLILVSSAVFEQATAVYLEVKGSGVNLTFLRSLRVLKVAKAMRLVKVVKFVTELRLVIDCFMASTQSLFWAIVVITGFLFLYGIYFVQAMASYLDEAKGELSNDVRHYITDSFGSVQQAMVTLFECVSGGRDWGSVYQLVKMSGMGNAIVFLFFMFFYMVSVWNIMTSMYVERTMQLAQPDEESLALSKQRQDILDGMCLLDLCRRVDTDSNETISLDELRHFMEKPEFRRLFEIRGIDVKDTEMFYKMLADAGKTDEVNVNAFAVGCMKLKGYATSMDLHTVGWRMHTNQERMQKDIMARFKTLSKKISANDSKIIRLLDRLDRYSPTAPDMEAEDNRREDSGNSDSDIKAISEWVL